MMVGENCTIGDECTMTSIVPLLLKKVTYFHWKFLCQFFSLVFGFSKHRSSCGMQQLY
jgi:hypothetical protein